MFGCSLRRPTYAQIPTCKLKIRLVDVLVLVSSRQTSVLLHMLTSSLVNAEKSSTYNLTDQGAFTITYADQTGSSGDYIKDTLSIGGATIKALEMGLAYNSSSSTGVMGIGYSLNEASDDSRTEQVPFTYPSIVETMVSQGLINTKAYSLYLDDLEASTGSIIFGGYDTKKYQGTLSQLPIVPETLENGTSVYQEFGVAMSGMGISGKTLTNSTYADVAILDSGTALVYVAPDLMELIVKDLGAVDDTKNTQNIYVNCNLRNASTIFDFSFGGTTIGVPASEMIFDLKGIFSADPNAMPTLPFSSVCALGIQGQDGGPPYILGDTFLRSAYVVYDLKNNLIGIAQTNFDSTSSNVVEFQASATSIPTASGVAATGVVNPSGAKTKNAGVSTIPEFDARRLLVLGISAGFAVFGGMLLV